MLHIKQSSSSNKFLILAVLYVFLALVGLFILTLVWLPPGYTLAGHDSGLPLDSGEFLKSRLYAWDDRLGFGLDNSANLGSITIHFFDWVAATFAGTHYAGNFISPFFWLGLIFTSGLFFAYQLKEKFGKPFVFILPPLLVFNFYIFQSMFMLERGKFGIFSATLIMLGILFRMQSKKLRVAPAAIITSLAFSIFNGGGLFGITLYGGAILVFVLWTFYSLSAGQNDGGLKNFRQTLTFLVLSIVLYAAFNAYSIVPFFNQFLTNDPNALFSESLVKGNQAWLEYVSRSATFLNLFRLYGVPDWYGGWEALDLPNESHPYAFLYLKNKALVFISFLLPILSFSGIFLAKNSQQRRALAFFAMIALIGLFFAAGSHKPLGFVYSFLMEKLPGFVLFRSAFYKFGIFSLLGMLVIFASTLSMLLEKTSSFLSQKWGKSLLVVGTLFFLSLWFAYHWVLFDKTKVFAWKADQTTKVQPPEYIFDFSKWTEQNNLQGRRVLLLPPVNKDWEADAYNWGYWSLSPLPYALSSINALSNWHGLNNEERELVDNLYSTVKEKNETGFLALAETLNVGYVLIRHDVLTNSSWSSTEQPENYQEALESFQSVEKIQNFREWNLYKTAVHRDTAVYTTSAINIVLDKYISLANDFFKEGHSVGTSDLKLYPDIGSLDLKKMDVYDCISCPLERKANLQSFPDVSVLPNSIFYPLKEKQEQKLLLQSKDPKSKMLDYLGLVLRKTAEQRKMIDEYAKEKYLIKNAKTIREYLDKIYSVLQSLPETSQDFETVTTFLDFLNPIEHTVSDYTKSSQFKAASSILIEEMLGVAWNLNKINEFFAPLLENTEKWSNQKVYKINIPQNGEYNLFFPTASFPRNKDGKTILPKTVELRKERETKTLELEKQQDSWFKAHIDFETTGKANLVLHFEELPNLLTIDGSRLEKFSYGEAACFQGSIANFDRKRTYEVRISRTDRIRPVKIIFSDKSFVYSKKHGFLQGEDSFEVPATTKGNFARYVFSPSASADTIFLYICSDNAELPKIDKIEVKEYFAPPVIGVLDSTKTVTSSVATLAPDTHYIRTNSTSYEAEVGDAQVPYVLVLNQKFNQSWKLSIKNQDGNLEPINKHFKVGGYANGWLVSQTDAKKFQIEYTPQSIFRVSAVFSLASVFVGLSWLVVSLIRRKDGTWKR